MNHNTTESDTQQEDTSWWDESLAETTEPPSGADLRREWDEINHILQTGRLPQSGERPTDDQLIALHELARGLQKQIEIDLVSQDIAAEVGGTLVELANRSSDSVVVLSSEAAITPERVQVKSRFALSLG